MAKINLPKEYQDLINSSGRTLEELLGLAAEYAADCDNCAIKDICDKAKAKITCGDLWIDHLRGVHNAEA